MACTKSDTTRVEELMMDQDGSVADNVKCVKMAYQEVKLHSDKLRDHLVQQEKMKNLSMKWLK